MNATEFQEYAKGATMLCTFLSTGIRMLRADSIRGQRRLPARVGEFLAGPSLKEVPQQAFVRAGEAELLPS